MFFIVFSFFIFIIKLFYVFLIVILFILFVITLTKSPSIHSLSLNVELAVLAIEKEKKG